jgi:bacteriorhodopsin
MFSLSSSVIAQAPTPERFGVDLGNMENYFEYSIAQWSSVSHVLTLGVGIFAAAFVYFLATIRTVAPKYRLSNVLSGVVMISAMIILLRQSMAWDFSFVLNPDTGEYVRRDGQAFSNGYRYMNWSIDVPVLLLQMLVVLPLAAKKKISYATQFVVAGLGMIWTSWAAQFYETGGVVVDGTAVIEGSSSAPFWIWYLLGWAFYVWIVAIVWKTIREGIQLVPERAGKILNAILWVFLVAWTAYAVAIVLPQFWFTAEAGVARAFIFTIADVVSKAIYGVMLGMVAVIISREEGYDYNAIRPQMIETDAG